MKGTRRSHFKPTNIELLNILEGRIVRDKRCTFITDMRSLYEREPWLLQHVRHVSFKDNEWFYFVKRNKPPGMKKAESKRPSRKVAESGIWKTSGKVVQIKNQDGVIVGSKKHISFKANCDTEKDGITTGWTMHEFVLDRPLFQEVVICRIRFHKRKDNAQYAPRFVPIVIGRERGDSTHHGVAAAGEEQDAPVETHQAQGMEQWTGSCSSEVVSYLASQQIMVQDSNYQILNGGMMQHNNIRGGQATYVSDPIELASQQQDLGEDSNLPLTQQQNQTVPTNTQQLQHDNVIINSAAQLHTEAQDNVPLINQTTEAQATDLPVSQGIDESHGGNLGSSSYNELFQEFLGEQEMDSAMDNINWDEFFNDEWFQKL